MIEQSKARVVAHTAPKAQAEIERRLECNVSYFARNRDQIDVRLRELDEEWDIERVLETNSSAISLFGLVMAVLGGKRWLLLPIVVQGFFLQHALQGWCPPLPALRRLGVRTRDEIERERYALKVLRGDFGDVDGESDDRELARHALAATG